MLGVVSDLWGSFERDPRDPAYADLRAGDRDRDVILGALGDAYARGQLSRDEFDERSGEVSASRTLGQLVPLVRDLDPSAVARPAGALLPAGTDATEIHERAVAHYLSRRNQAVGGLFVGANLICWAIYIYTVVSGHGTYFPWPLFVTFGTLGNIVRVVTSRGDIIADKEQELLAEARERALPPAEKDERAETAEHDDDR